MLVEEVAQRILDQHSLRSLVAIAGPPGSGKSTLADNLCVELNRLSETELAVVLPMDGFHLDNDLLDADNTRQRKGAAHTFDFDGFHYMLQRVSQAKDDVVIPTFDRSLDLARAGARRITREHKVVLIEGNYLLLDEAPWQQLSDLFDYRIFLDVPEAVLSQRLHQRWIDHGHTPDEAMERAQTNDIPNAELVMRKRLAADLVLPNG